MCRRNKCEFIISDIADMYSRFWH